MNVAGLRLSVYFGESLTIGTQLASDAIVELFADHGAPMAALFRGIEGYGASRRIKLASFPDISTDLPLVATAVDTPERIKATLDDVDQVVSRGLVTLEHVQLMTGEDIVQADAESVVGRTAKLAIYCGRGERIGTARAYHAVVDLLQRHGLPGATVFFGVDGLSHGVRQRARLFGRNVDVPVMIVALGGVRVLQRVLPLLSELLPEAFLTLEAVNLVKHDGEPLQPFQVSVAGTHRPIEGWQSLEIYSRRNATYEGRAIYAEVTRRLRRLGAAGVTTISGEWGFSSEERPHGDKPWTTSSYLPTCTRYIDHSAKVLEVWPMIDELTSEHGIVLSQFVAAYRERAGVPSEGQVVAQEGSLLALAQEAHGASLEEDETEPTRSLGPHAAPLLTDESTDSREAQWLRGLTCQVMEFARARERYHVAVRVSLVDGEEFFLAHAEASPGGGFVTLYPHSRRHSDLVQGAGGQALPARGLVIPLTSIGKIELLPKVPRGARSLMVFHPHGPE